MRTSFTEPVIFRMICFCIYSSSDVRRAEGHLPEGAADHHAVCHNPYLDVLALALQQRRVLRDVVVPL